MGGSDLFTGTLDILILRTTRAEALHGYAIGKALRELSEGVLSVDEGALYPALHRLERKGLLEAAWGRTETGRRARFYRATEAGLAHFQAEAARWSEFSGAVAGVLGEQGG
jgi:transcriptional regulator